MSDKKIEVNFWSDIACCWCYVGETILKQAIKEFNKNHPDVKVDLIFHSYFIGAQANEGGEDFLEFNKRKWNGDGWTKELKEKGKKYGCDFGNWKFWPNTTLCHKLVSAAKKVGKCNEVVEELFLSLYEQGKNVSIESTLNEVASKYGITGWNTEENLKLAKDDEKIGKKKYGIKEVPYFIFPNDEVVEGSSDPETFLKALEQAYDNL